MRMQNALLFRGTLIQHVNRRYLRMRMQNVEEKKRIRSGSVDTSIIIRPSRRLIGQRWTT